MDGAGRPLNHHHPEIERRRPSDETAPQLSRTFHRHNRGRIEREQGDGSASARDFLVALGIRLRRYSEGGHNTTCPRCSAKRSVAHRKEPCLYVKITHEGCGLRCYNCDWRGGTKGGERDERRPISRARHVPASTEELAARICAESVSPDAP